MVDQVGEDHPLVAHVGRAGDRPELAAFLVLGQHIQGKLFLAAVHLVGATVFYVLNHGRGQEGDRSEHLCPAQKAGGGVANQVLTWALKK